MYIFIFIHIYIYIYIYMCLCMCIYIYVLYTHVEPCVSVQLLHCLVFDPVPEIPDMAGSASLNHGLGLGFRV